MRGNASQCAIALLVTWLLFLEQRPFTSFTHLRHLEKVFTANLLIFIDFRLGGYEEDSDMYDISLVSEAVKHGLEICKSIIFEFFYTNTYYKCTPEFQQAGLGV